MGHAVTLKIKNHYDIIALDGSVLPYHCVTKKWFDGDRNYHSYEDMYGVMINRAENTCTVNDYDGLLAALEADRQAEAEYTGKRTIYGIGETNATFSAEY